MMDQSVAVKEMFDGLYNIIVGPGFYTVSGAKRKKLKVSKSSLQSMESHEDTMSSVSDQDSYKDEKDSTPENAEVASKSSAGSDPDIISDDNASSINSPNMFFVSHEPSKDITRTEYTVSSELKHNNLCDRAVLLTCKQTTDDKGLCASLKSKSYVTKEQGCASRYGYSKEPTDLTRSSRGNGRKTSTVSVGRADKSDVTSRKTKQGESLSSVSGVSHKTNNSGVTSKQSLSLQGDRSTDISHKINNSGVTSKQSWSLQGDRSTDVSHKTNNSGVTSKQSWSLQGDRSTDVSHKTNNSGVTSKQSWSLQGDRSTDVSHKTNNSGVTSKQSWSLQGDRSTDVSHKTNNSGVTSKQSWSLQGDGSTDVSHKTKKSHVTSKHRSSQEGPTDVLGVSHVSHKTDKSDKTSKQPQSSQGQGPTDGSRVSHKTNKSDVTSKQFRPLQRELPSDVSHVPLNSNPEDADLTISSRRSLGKPPLSHEKPVKSRMQPSLSVSAEKLHQEQKTTASILKSDVGRSVTNPDLTVSSRRSSGRHHENQSSPEKSVRPTRQASDEATSLSVNVLKLQEEQQTTASIPNSDDRMPGTVLGSVPSSAKDVDARSDISTDSHTSGYAQPRTAVLSQPSSGGKAGDNHRRQRKKTVPGNPSSRSPSPVKKTCDKSETKISRVKRKLDDDAIENLCRKKVKTSQGSREKGSEAKRITDNHKRQTPTKKKGRTKTRRKEKQTKQCNTTGSVKYQKLLSLGGLINLKKPKQCSYQSPAKGPNRNSRGHIVQRQLRSSTKNLSAKHSSPTPNKHSPRKPSLRTMPKTQYSKHTQNRHCSTKQTVHTRKKGRSDSKHRIKQDKQGSDIDKHKIKSGRRRSRPSADALSMHEALAKQQQVIAEHCKEKDKFEDGNIISALCQLEDRAKTLHSHDLDLLMPMYDLPTNQNAVLGVRGQGKNTHPGGVWKKLIPEN